MVQDLNQILEIRSERNEPGGAIAGAGEAENGSIFSFRGRIGRGRFWATIVPLLLVSMGLNVAVAVSDGRSEPVVLLFIAFAYFIFATWVAVATYVKRWHDLGMSGWMVLIMLIPIVNILVLLFLGIAPGQPEVNRFGAPPGSPRA